MNIANVGFNPGFDPSPDISGGNFPFALVGGSVTPVGDGGADLRGQLKYFRDFGNNFDLRLLLDRKIQLTDRATECIPAPGQLLVSAVNKKREDRNLGDFWGHDIALGHIWVAWRVL